MGFFFRRKRVEESVSESESEPESDAGKEEDEEIEEDSTNAANGGGLDASPRALLGKEPSTAEESKLDRRARLAAERAEAERLEEEEVIRLAAEAAALEELEARELEEWDKRKKAEAVKLAVSYNIFRLM